MEKNPLVQFMSNFETAEISDKPMNTHSCQSVCCTPPDVKERSMEKLKELRLPAWTRKFADYRLMNSKMNVPSV